MLRLKYTSMFSGLMAACALIMSAGTTGAEAVDVQNDVMDVTLFRGAGNNSWFEVYFKADLVNGADKVEVETLDIDLRPKRDVTLHVEIFNPDGKLPLIITPGGNGDTDGFGNFARNVAVAAPDFKVIIYDRRNLGRSSINFGDSPQMIEEGEDLHALIEHLDIAPATLYGMSSGGRSNLVVASKYPEDIAALVLAPLTGGPLAAARLSEEYFFKYLNTESLTTMTHISDSSISSMEDLGKTPLWSAYLERNQEHYKKAFFGTHIDDFLSSMKTSGTHLRSAGDQTALGMQDRNLAALTVPATLILHHGSYKDYLHPITNSRAATTLIPNSSLEFAPFLPEILEHLIPFVRSNTPALRQ